MNEHNTLIHRFVSKATISRLIELLLQQKHFILEFLSQPIKVGSKKIELLALQNNL